MSFSNGRFVIKLNREEEGLGLGFVRFTRGLGRKRVLISKSNQEINSYSDRALAVDSPPVKIELKRPRNVTAESDRSLLESLHRDILIRVLCHVDHEDLGRLKRVSKTIRNAVMEAKKLHFDFSTPKKKMSFRDALLIFNKDSNSNNSSNSSNQYDETEPPNAPSRRRNINRESDLSKVSMVLFK